MMNSGARQIRQAREAKGWSQRELARQAAITGAFVCQIEAGKRKPGRAISAKLQALLGVPPESFDADEAAQ